nr:prepilin peptidase [uncultured Clostridium sp.]
MAERMNCIVFGMFLLAAAWEDGRRKSIRIQLFISAGAAGIVLCFLQREDLTSRLTGCLVGLALLAVSRLTKESVGTGDGCFFIISGLFFPALFNLKLLVYGLSLCGIFCGLFFLINRVNGVDVGKEKIPFIPFLVPVWLIMVMR